MCLSEENIGVGGSDCEGGGGLERRWRRSVHAGEPVYETILCVGDVVDEENEGEEVAAPAHDLGHQCGPSSGGCWSRSL